MARKKTPTRRTAKAPITPQEPAPAAGDDLTQVVEQIDGALTDVKVERAQDGNGVVSDVPFLGLESKNGYAYRQEAAIAAVPQYNGVLVFLNHAEEGKKSKDRNVRQIGGVTENARWDEPTMQIRGDIRAKGTRSAREDFLDLAEASLPNVGMSHVARIRTADDGSVDLIGEVVTIDTVAFPATVKTFTEQDGRPVEAGSESTQAPAGSFEGIRDQLDALVRPFLTGNGIEAEYHWIEYTYPDHIIVGSDHKDDTPDSHYRIDYTAGPPITLTGTPTEVEVSTNVTAKSSASQENTSMDPKELEAKLQAIEVERDGLKAQVAQITQERDALQAKVEQAEAAERVRVKRGEIVAAIEASELPKEAVYNDKGESVYIERLVNMDVEDAKADIAERVAFLKSQSETPVSRERNAKAPEGEATEETAERDLRSFFGAKQPAKTD